MFFFFVVSSLIFLSSVRPFYRNMKKYFTIKTSKMTTAGRGPQLNIIQHPTVIHITAFYHYSANARFEIFSMKY